MPDRKVTIYSRIEREVGDTMKIGTPNGVVKGTVVEKHEGKPEYQKTVHDTTKPNNERPIDSGKGYYDVEIPT